MSCLLFVISRVQVFEVEVLEASLIYFSDVPSIKDPFLGLTMKKKKSYCILKLILKLVFHPACSLSINIQWVDLGIQVIGY